MARSGSIGYRKESSLNQSSWLLLISEFVICILPLNWRTPPEADSD